jgi:hypothetical protein
MSEEEVIKYGPEIHSPIFIRKLEEKDNFGNILAIFKCRFNGCNNEFQNPYNRVKNKITKSCGCYADYNKKHMFLKHGRSYTSEYKIWTGLKIRCTNPKFKRYKGRGIKVCERWTDEEFGFINFINDMGPRPSKKHSVERRDNNGDYCPENCYWATMKEQSRNRENNVPIEYKGQTKILRDWTNELKLNHRTIYNRLISGWKIEEAFETPIIQKNILYEYNGKELTLKEWSIELNIDYSTLVYHTGKMKRNMYDIVKIREKTLG